MIRAVLFSSLVWASGAVAQIAYTGGQELISPSECPTTPESWSERALQRSLETPLGLPPMPHPEENPPTKAKIELGRKLFFDRRLSINKTMSCAMCHVPEQGFANWELSTAVGVEGRSIKRNAPTVINVGYHTTLFHDGRDPSLETQFIGPITARNEMANPSAGHVVSLLRYLPDYEPHFDAAFGASPSLDRIGMALGSYQRSLMAGDSPFDQWLYGGLGDAVSEEAKQGFEIFTGKGQCSSCHGLEANHALFTDELFHDTGYGRMREGQRQNPPETLPIEIAPGIVHEVDFQLVASVSGPREADLGRYEVTEEPSDRWKFRTPSLRNVAMTPPYMHDGHFTTLEEVIAFYNAGGMGHPGQDSRIKPLGLSGQEIQQLKAFLTSLTSPDLACLTAEARIVPPDNH